MAEGLASRGYVIDAQAIAEEYTEDYPRAPLAFWQLSYPRPYSNMVEAAAEEFEVDPLLIWAVMREESRYEPEALSYAGARGLMQVIPSTQTWIAGQLGEDLSPGDAYTPQASIRMGAWLLHFLTEYFEGDLELVIAAYNGGAASVDSWQADPLVSNRDDLLRWIGFGETREYLQRVSLSYQVYQELYAKNKQNVLDSGLNP
jgi:soluble lytic murein transglycosylase